MKAKWKTPVKVTLRERGGVIDIVGIDRSNARAGVGIDDKRRGQTRGSAIVKTSVNPRF